MMTRRSLLASWFAARLLNWNSKLEARDITDVFSGSAKSTDARLGSPINLNGYFPFHVPDTRSAWESRRKQLREQLLVANGLWPLPEKTPLNPVVHGRLDRDGYTIEKVYFASRPGHYVTGNLYRPTGNSESKRPGVLFAHGHWADGRFHTAADKDAEAAVRAKGEATFDRSKYFMQAIPITLARLGYVVFQYDMVGYADSTILEHRSGFRDVQAELSAQSIMGLQTWNSLRALDFLTSLPDVNPEKLGMTGASGGGTQTFILGAIDDRLSAIFPAVMVSAEMQGGCVCENCSLLRINTGNVEIAAMFAPKPLAMSCANDWTKQFLKTGYGLPELKKLYSLYGGKPENVEAKAWLEYGHNYNQRAREFMYSWFEKHLHGREHTISEPTFSPLTSKELTVFDSSHPLPSDALKAAELQQSMRLQNEEWLKNLRQGPIEKFREIVAPALRAMINSEVPERIAIRQGPLESKHDGYTMHRAVLGRVTEKDAIPCAGIFGPKFTGEKIVIWADPKGKSSLIQDDKPVPVAKTLLDQGFAIISGDLLGTGEQQFQTPYAVDENYAGYTLGYNRSLLANRVHDLLTLIAFGKSILKATSINLVGRGEAGPWVVLAAALAGDRISRVAVDMNRFGFDQIDSFRHPMLLPAAGKYGGMSSFLALCAPTPMLIHHQPSLEPIVRKAYSDAELTHSSDKWSDAKVIEWLTQ